MPFANCCAIPPLLPKTGFIASTITPSAPARSVKPGSDAGCLPRSKYANKILAATTDCNSLYCRTRSTRRRPHRRGRSRTKSHLFRRATTGRDRQPEFRKPIQAGEFLAAARGGRRNGRSLPRFRHPVTGGNVSLYNESPTGVVDPTPTVGMVGLIENERTYHDAMVQECWRRDHPRGDCGRRPRRGPDQSGASRVS